MKTKILLVNPISADPPPVYFGPPYGLALIAAVLEKNGFEPICFDFDEEEESEMQRRIIDEIKSDGIRYVGISIQSSNRAYVYRLSEVLKARFPELTLILGGPFASQKYKLILENFPIDYIVMGDGEMTMSELMSSLETDGRVDDVDGLAFKNKNMIVLTGERERIKDLDELPYPAFHLFPVPERLNKQADFLISEIGKRKLAELKGKRCVSLSNALMILSSIGCIYGCSFCPMSGVSKDKYREHSPKYFVDMLEYFFKFYKQKQFVIGDNFFTRNREHVLGICRLIIERKLNIEWICMTRSDYVDREMLLVMREAGCIEISFGVETAAESVQKKIGKNLDLSKLQKAFLDCDYAGIRATLMLMVGNQGETKKTVYKTLVAVRELEPEEALVKITKSYPGTRINELMEKNGKIKSDYYLKDESSPPVFTLEHTEEELRMYKKMMKGRNIIIETKLPSGEKKSTRELENDILRLAKRSKFMTLAIGNIMEREDVFELVTFAKNARIDKVILEIDGRGLRDLEYINRLLRTGIYGIKISFPHYISSKFESISGGSDIFSEVVSGVDNIVKYRNELLKIHIPIQKANYKELRDLVEYLLDKGVKDLVLEYNPELQSQPSAEELKKSLVQVLPILKSSGVDFSLSGVPYCLAGSEYEDNVDDIHRPWDEIYDYTCKLINIGKKRRLNRTKTNLCFDCKYDLICEGFWKGYEFANKTGVDRMDNTSTLLVTISRKCQLDCSYCYMEKSPDDMSLETLRKSIDLLLTSTKKDLELQFFGGEPLLRFDLIKEGVEYAQRQVKLAEKNINFLITSNAISLDEKMLEYFISKNISLMFSLDGSYESNFKSRRIEDKKIYKQALNNILKAKHAGADYFVNITVRPTNAKQLKSDIQALSDKGLDNIKLSYALGEIWKKEEQESYIYALNNLGTYISTKNGGSTTDIMQSRQEEPVLSSPVLIADTDGSLYSGCSLVTEKRLNSLSEIFYKGKVSEIDNINILKTTRKEQMLKILENTNSSKEEDEIILNNLSFGEKIKYNGKGRDDNSAFLEVQLTSQCQLNCAYCSLDRTKPDMDLPMLKKGIDFLFSSDKSILKLQFFGGEPLLRLDLIEEGISYAEEKASQAGKEISFIISTNALMLNSEILAYIKEHSISLIFSLDGCFDTQLENRPLQGGESHEYPYEQMKQNLKKARDLGIEMFVNMVVRPDQAEELENNLLSIKNDINDCELLLSYELGEMWSEDKKSIYINLLKIIATEHSQVLNLVNFDINDEPVMAAVSINLDYDGKLYYGCTLSMNKAFPSLIKINLIGGIDDIGAYDDIRRNRIIQAKHLLNSDYLSQDEANLVRNNLIFGLDIKESLNAFSSSGEEKQNNKRMQMDANEEIIGENIKLLRSPETLNNLMLMTTYNCQMECNYCKVKQKNGNINEDICRKASDLLFSSGSNQLVLRFFGGEPLLNPELVLNAMAYTEELVKKSDKTVRYIITTNGELLSDELIDKLQVYNTEIMLSLDGKPETFRKYRKIKGGSEGEKIYSVLIALQKTDMKFFVNMLICRSNLKDAIINFTYLVDLGCKRIQVCYESGEFWEKQEIMKLFEVMEKISAIAKARGIVFMNINNEAEPVMLSDEILVDVDGRIYYDIAIFHELSFPELRQTMHLEDVNSLKRLDDIKHNKYEIYTKLLSTYPVGSEKRKMIVNNISVGLAIRDLFENKIEKDVPISESKLITGFVRAGIKEQEEIKEKYKLPINSNILHINNNCINNCIFCKNKKLEYASLELIEYKLRENANNKKLCLVGNEPLNHPRITEIFQLIASYGFKDVEIMSSGMFLKDEKRVRELVSFGMSSVAVPIYSHKEEVHDKIVGRKGDYNDLMEAISAIKQNGKIKLYLHSNLLLENFYDIEEMEFFAEKCGASGFIVLPVRKKSANYDYKSIVPSFTRIVDELKANSLVGFPLCIIKKVQKTLLLDSSIISNVNKLYLISQNFIKPEICSTCAMRKKCAGVFKEYLDIYGENDLCPF